MKVKSCDNIGNFNIKVEFIEYEIYDVLNYSMKNFLVDQKTMTVAH